MSENKEATQIKWHHPMEVMKMHKIKLKKQALQARIKGSPLNTSTNSSQDKTAKLEDIVSAKKRKNPFLVNKENEKKNKTVVPPITEESADQTLFNLLHRSDSSSSIDTSLTSFNNILNKTNEYEKCEIVKAKGEPNPPIDWALKSKIRLLSAKPFPWSSKLKISEETSGLVSFIRCLVNDTQTTLDISPNAKFHQCCLFWQAPHLPWLTLFPRTVGKLSSQSNFPPMNAAMRENLHISWTDSLRSLFQLLRTRQCPFFYVCTNTFTVLFRAAGINGFSEIHALITPSTRGLRQLLRQEEIEFTLPLKKKRMSDQGYDTQDSTISEGFGGESECYDGALAEEDDDDEPDDQWFKRMGFNAEDIKQINYTQARITQKKECEIDNGEQSLILVQGIEVLPLYNFLINCKSATANVGNLAGVPPTLLAPVAFTGGTLQSLRVREHKVHLDDSDYYCLDLVGPILPTLIHNLFTICPPEHNVTATCVSIPSTIPFTKVTHKHAGENKEEQGKNVFGKENLSDCGLNTKVLKHFCSLNTKYLDTLECLKYTSDNRTFTWT